MLARRNGIWSARTNDPIGSPQPRRRTESVVASALSKGLRIVVVAVLFGAFAGCENSGREPDAGPSGSSGDAQQTERQWLGELSLDSSVGDRPGVMLGRPALLTAGPEGGFALGDYADHMVRVFDGQGKEKWAFGREGSGPGEFVNFTDLSFDPDGNLAVLDPEQQRVTLIDRRGALVSTLRLPDPSHRLLPSHASGEDWVLTSRDSAHLWVAVSKEGKRTGASSLPAELRVEHPLIGDSFTTRSEMGAIIAYRWSSHLVFLDKKGAVRGIIHGVERVDFPTLWDGGHPAVSRVDPEAVPAARDVSAALGKVFVLFTGSELDDSRAVDVYDEASMAYVGSYRVPKTVMDIAALADGRLATLETDLVPTVKIWSP